MNRANADILTTAVMQRVTLVAQDVRNPSAQGVA